eukprot:XP_011681177.1 PREDICTED: uncharacterized protein LOC105446276 [Strongylocentrotus purpuratus]
MMAEYEGEGINQSFTDPTQEDDIYPPPPGFDSPSNNTDRYRQYDEGDVERSAQRNKPEASASEMNDENKRRASVTKKIWIILKGTFICACPLFIIGLLLVVLGMVKIPASYDLTKPGAPILIIAMIFLIITIILLVVYKMRGINAYSFGQKEMTGVTNNGVNSSTQRSTHADNRNGSNKDSEDHREDREYNESRRI